MAFVATLSYELHPQTEPDAAKLLRAELVGRRWQDRFEGDRMPANTLWMKRDAARGQTTDDVHAACGGDLRAAVAKVAGMGRKIAVLRAWVQVTGAGTYGLVLKPAERPGGAPDEPPAGPPTGPPAGDAGVPPDVSGR